MELSGRYQPLQNLVQVVVNPALFSRDVSIATTAHEAWHALAFTQMPEEQRLLVGAFPGEAAVKRFLAEHPKIAARAIAALGTQAWQDPVGVFGATYAVRMVRGQRVAKPAEHAFRRFRRWIEKEIDAFEKHSVAERWRQVERNPRAEIEIPFLNDKRGLLVCGPAADRARQASPAFKRIAKRCEDSGYWIERRHGGALREELRKAGYVARVCGPSAAFYDGAGERLDHEDCAAYAFGAWAIHCGAKPERTPVFGASVVTLERLINCLHGRGFQCLEDIFERARWGSMARRDEAREN